MSLSPTLTQARATARRQARRVADEHVRRALRSHGIDPDAPVRRKRIRLWLPVSLLWIFFPFVVLLSPIALAWRGRPDLLVSGVAGVIAGLSGIAIEVESPDADVRIHLF